MLTSCLQGNPVAAARGLRPGLQVPWRLGLGARQQHSTALPRPRVRAVEVAAAADLFLLGTADLDTILPALPISQEAALVASAIFAVISVVVNLWGGWITEQKRAELSLQVDREKQRQTTMQEMESVATRYRGPLLEATIELEHKLGHLCCDEAIDLREVEMRYTLFTLAQFLGLLEVVRREGPRERNFLQMDSPLKSVTLGSLLEAVRFVLSASIADLEEWYSEGAQRRHPGARRRRPSTEVAARQRQQPRQERCKVQQQQQLRQGAEVASEEGQAGAAGEGGGSAPEVGLLRMSRGEQRGLGSLMIITPIGSDRHYTQPYGDFTQRLQSDPFFCGWCTSLERDLLALAQGPAWGGEPPFPSGRWTRVLLLQQLLVEMMDLLDPGCVRLLLERRVRLSPVRWAALPGLIGYEAHLQELQGRRDATELSGLEGLRDLTWDKWGSSVDEAEGILGSPFPWAGNGSSAGLLLGTQLPANGGQQPVQEQASHE